VHPDTGIVAKRVPSRYEAVVAIDEGDIEPEEVGAKLASWATENGYLVAGPAEVFVHADESSGFDLALPLRRRPIDRFLDL
jgi:hypothetical protein